MISVHQRDSSFFIGKGVQRAAFLAAKKVQPHRWVDSDAAKSAHNLASLLAAWNWCAIGNKRGDITDIEFSSEVGQSDDPLWEALAPFVRSGSFIEMQDEDGEAWRWRFRDGKFSAVELAFRNPDADEAVANLIQRAKELLRESTKSEHLDTDQALHILQDLAALDVSP